MNKSEKCCRLVWQSNHTLQLIQWYSQWSYYRMLKFKSAESPQCNTSTTSKASKGQWWKFELCDTSYSLMQRYHVERLIGEESSLSKSSCDLADLIKREFKNKLWTKEFLQSQPESFGQKCWHQSWLKKIIWRTPTIEQCDISVPWILTKNI